MENVWQLPYWVKYLDFFIHITVEIE